MTFRQALAVVWRQRLLVLVVVVLAIAAAAVFLVRQAPVYTAPVTVRMNALVASAASSGQIGTATVDVTPDSLSSASVLRDAARRAGETTASAQSWNVGYSVAGTGSSQTESFVVTITANGSTAALAQTHVDAIEKAYNAYLADQTTEARRIAEAQVTKWTAEAQADQTLVDKNPTNSIAQSNLSTAIASLQQANATISQIDTAGQPLIISKASTPGEFQGTSPLIAIAVALAAGLIAGIGIVLIWDAFDDRVRPDDDMEELAGTPTLGELSLDAKVRRGGDRLPVAGRDRTTLNEGLRSLRTTLQVLLPSGSDVIVVTSVEPGDGKTFISSNLALAWARVGKRVILVGGDLRNAGLEGYFGEAATGPGLTELLQAATSSGSTSSYANIADALNETAYKRLRILPSGEEPWDPADLLALDALGSVVFSLREHADVVVIDSPPSLALVDARLLAAHADGVVVVASARRTRLRPLTATVQALIAGGAPVLGIVMNRSRRRIPKSYSAYYGAAHRPPAASAEDAAAASATDRVEDDAAVEPDDDEWGAEGQETRRQQTGGVEEEEAPPDDEDDEHEDEDEAPPADAEEEPLPRPRSRTAARPGTQTAHSDLA